MNKNLVAGVLLLASSATIAVFVSTGCNKTDHPFGVSAPHGFDVPTQTPTPEVGGFNCYVVISGTDVLGVTVAMVDPAGVTEAVTTTQPLVSYAPFGFNPFANGVWKAIVPSQSVTFVSSGVTFKYSFGNSVQPVTVSGGGIYPVTFSGWEGNNVFIAPVTQTMTLVLPDFIPTTINYQQTGNLDIPVSVTMSGINSLPGWNYINPQNVVMGGSISQYSVTIEKNGCMAATQTLSLTTTDFSNNSITSSGATIYRGFQIPVTLFVNKYNGTSNCGSGIGETLAFLINSSNDCGQAIWNVSWSFDGTYQCNKTLANGQQATEYEAAINHNVSYTVSSPYGSFSGSFMISSIPWSPSWQQQGSGNF